MSVSKRKFEFVSDMTLLDLQKLEEFIEEIGNDNNAMMEMYKDLAPHYDKYMDKGDDNEKDMCTDKIVELLGDKKEARILDVGAGTGRVGHLLRNNGFYNIDALDCCEEMLAIAKKCIIYKAHNHFQIGKDDIQITSNSYDAVVACQSFCLGHIPPSSLRDLVRITKPEGVIVFNVFDVDLKAKEFDLDEQVQKLVDEGKWALIEQTDKSDLWNAMTGKLMTFKVL